MSVNEDVQGLSVGELVELYMLDLTRIGGAMYYFTPTARDDGLAISYQGQTYVSIDVWAEGFETSSNGPFPQPTIKIANVTRSLSGLVRTLDDLIGAKVTRIRTLKKYLDGEPLADPTAHFPPDVFFVEQKTAETKLLIEFKLTSAIDVEGQKVPRRQVLRNYCSHIYRTFNPSNGTFNYTRATCPFGGYPYYTQEGNLTYDPALDKCGKRITDCQKRFGYSAVLPTRAFPGAGKFGGL